jgi:hypothetical protein
MKRNIFFGTLFSAALAVGVAAQGTATGSQQSSAQNQRNQQVTVTGCLKTADSAGATAGTTGTGTAGSQAGSTARGGAQFMLTDAKITSRGSGAATSGTSGTGTGTGAAGAGASATGASENNRFLLTGGDQQDLKKYLNSEVEIRGTLQGSNRSGAGTGAAAGTGTGTGTGTGAATSGTRAQNDQNAQMLRVTSVTQKSATCAGE